MDLLQKAIDAGKRRDYKSAVNLLNTLIHETEDNWTAYMYLGRSYHALGEYGKAIQSFLNVPRTIEPSVDFFVGRSYLSAELYSRAVFHFQHIYENGHYPPQLYPFMGMSLFKLKKYTLANKFFEKAHVHFPEDKRITSLYQQNVYILALKLFHKEKFEEALDLFMFLYKSGMDHISLMLYCGYINEELGRYKNALVYYEKAMVLSPEDTAIRIRIIDCLFKNGDIEGAEELLQSLNQNAESYIDKNQLNKALSEYYYENGDFSRAIRFGVRDLKKSGHTVDMHLLLGVCYRETDQYTFAVNHFIRVLDLERINIQAFWGMLTVYWLTNEYEKCLHILQRISRYFPDDEIYEYYYPLVLVKIGDQIEKTIPLLQHLIENNPEDSYLLLNLGEEYIRASQIGRAYEILSQAIEYKEHKVESYRKLIQVCVLLQKESELITMYPQYLKISEDDSACRYEYIQLLVGKNKYKQVIPEIELLLAVAEFRKKLLPVLAFCKRKTRAYAESGVLYKQLLRNDPENKKYLQSLVYCMLKLKKKDTALELMEKAEKFLKFNADLYLILGVLHFRNQNTEKAMQTFKNCLDNFPNDWRIYNNISLIYKKQGLDQYAKKYAHMSAKLASENKK